METGANQLCRTTPYINVSSQSGYLSSLVTSETSLGSDPCPWVIRLDPGQRINVTLYDFTLHDPFNTNDVTATSEQRAFCHKYAVIRERSAVTRETTVCGGEQRIKNVYLSASNVLEIHLSRYNSPKKAAYFLLRYEGR